VLDLRALNRATLARQLLLERRAWPVPRALEHLAGLQAQTSSTWYVSLWSRLPDLDPDAVGALVARGRLVRLALMRSTIHLVTARDAATLRPAVAGALARGVRGSAGADLEGLDQGLVVQAGRELVEAEPLTLGELGARLADRWPDRRPATLAHVVRAGVPLVQMPPRGVWGRSGPPRHTTLEALTGRVQETAPDDEGLVLRYLRAFGPATVADMQTWSGLARLAQVFERLRPRLKALRDERGRELWDLPRAPRPPVATAAPVRFLPDFDNLLLSHADRTRVIADEQREALRAPNAVQPGTVLVDGFVAASWRLERERRAARLEVAELTDITRAQREEIRAEGARLTAFLAADATSRDVRLPPG
jgi:hypothetical protein